MKIISLARTLTARRTRGAKDYLRDMLSEFDPSGNRSVTNAETYLTTLKGEEEDGDVIKTDYGPYTLAKHTLLYEYLKPFFQIGSKNFRRLVYIDMFAGPGLNVIERGGRTYVSPGSPLISYLYTYVPKAKARRERFDAYYFLEKNAKRAAALQRRLARVKHDFSLSEAPNVVIGDSQDKVWEIMEGEINNLKAPKKTEMRTNSGLLFLLFIDPEGLGLKFEELVKMLKRYVATMDGDTSQHYFTADVIYTAPTHWVKQSRNEEYLKTYCGIEPGGRYTDGEVAEFMSSKMKEEIGGKFFVHTIPVRNSKNSLMYHIFCATKSKGAADAMESLKSSLSLRSKDIESTLDALLGRAQSMDPWIE